MRIRWQQTVIWTGLSLLMSCQAYGYSDGPPNRRTWCGNQGADTVCAGGRCGSCTTCHATFGDPNSGSGFVEVANLPANYESGTQYTLAVFLDDSTNNQFAIGGFEVSALSTDGLCQAGDLLVDAPGTFVETEGSTNTQWLKHSRPQNSSGGTALWQFLWTAPDASMGDVAINVCGNAANDGDGSDNDRIYCSEVIVSPAAVSVPEPVIQMRRNASALDLGLDVSVPDFHIYRGALEDTGNIVTTTAAYEQVDCAGTGSSGIDPNPQFFSGSSFFYLVVPVAGGQEQSYGCMDRDALGQCTETRIPAAPSCP